MFFTRVPAWLATRNAHLRGKNSTMAFITVLALLVGSNLFCWAIAKRLMPRLGFSSRVKTPPTVEAKVMLQRVRVAVRRHGGPSLRQVVRALTPEMKAMLK